MIKIDSSLTLLHGKMARKEQFTVPETRRMGVAAWQGEITRSQRYEVT